MSEILSPLATIYFYGIIFLFFYYMEKYDDFGKAISRAILWPFMLLIMLFKELKGIWKEF